VGVDIDPACTATRHGTWLAYQKARCRCPDARADQSAYRKRRALLRARGYVGRTDYVPAWRVTRRLRALARIGYSQRDVVRMAWGYPDGDGGLSHSTWMTRGKFDKLDAVYRRLEGVPGPNRAAIAYAIRADFPSPLAWVNIDDPDEKPMTVLEAQRARWREASRRKKQAA
jgi:hypothetical protein